MRPSVLIIEDSPSTAGLARMALLDVPCDVTVAETAWRALDLLQTQLSPRVLVVDTHLPGVVPRSFVESLHAAAPAAAMVLLMDRGIATPVAPGVRALLLKPLAPRRFAVVVSDLLSAGEPPEADFDS
jgi:CheY-like chemotaxis protein